MRVNINNSEELKNELLRLSRLRREQELYLGDQYQLLKNKVKTPSRILGALTSGLPGMSLIKGLFSSPTNSGLGGVNHTGNKSDWLTKVTRIALPFVLNKTLLKNSGWLKKTLVILASEGAAGQISKDNVSSFVGKIADYIRPKKSKKKHRKVKSIDEQEIDPRVVRPEGPIY